MKLNKKGDISIIILVIGIIAICFLTIFSFIKAGNNVEESFVGIGLIETMNSIEEEQDFYDKSGFKGDYRESFTKQEFFGTSAISIKSNGLEGRYSVKGTGFLDFINPKEKILVKVIYPK
tara:strand:+ start:179 stop:538 length:360 start_codon:yes stop_codon:yes gene_type:complete